MAAKIQIQGAQIVSGGVRYRTWCEHERVEVLLVRPDGSIIRGVSLDQEGDGYFSAIDSAGKPSDLYRYRFNADDESWPDPASRAQPFGVHGPSMVAGATQFPWGDAGRPQHSLGDLVIYELHVGTFTPEGTFCAAISKLEHLRALGVNAIELMPIGDFSGERNWGYDGVCLYAPARVYGVPDDLRSLVDAAHERDLAVILDVVFNHLGPDGNYLGAFHREYFNPAHKTPWGAGLNFERPEVRSFFAENPIYWMREFHIDGFRLDATHAIADSSATHILAEISERIHAEGGFVIAEDERNEPALLRPVKEDGLGFDGCWSDDFHHVVRVMLTGEREGYYENFQGTSAELAETLRHGWLFRGQHQLGGESRGGESIEFDPAQFVYCISNHDQTGNRAFGERLNELIDAAAYRAASALLCLAPYTPMLFMGQEWSASTPFQFFTDHNEALGKLVTAGRRKEFGHFAAFRDPAMREKIPDPQAASTFADSKLRWDEIAESAHAGTLRLYQDLLSLRRNHPGLQNRARTNWKITEPARGTIALDYQQPDGAGCMIVVDLVGKREEMPEIDPRWRMLLSSNDPRYGGKNEPTFAVPTALIYENAKS